MQGRFDKDKKKKEDDRMNVPTNQISDVREADVATPKTSAQESREMRLAQELPINERLKSLLRSSVS